MNARDDLTETSFPADPTGLPWSHLLPGRSIRRRHGPKPRPWIALSILASLLLTLGSSVLAQEPSANTPEGQVQAVTDAVGRATGQGGSGEGSGSSEGSEGGGGGQGSSNPSSPSNGSGGPSATTNAGKATSAERSRTRGGDSNAGLSRTVNDAPPAQALVLETNDAREDTCLSKDTSDPSHVSGTRSLGAPGPDTAGFPQRTRAWSSGDSNIHSLRTASVGHPKISVRKTNDADGDGCFSRDEVASNVGGDVEFRIVVRNPGAAPVRIEQVLDSFGMLTIDVCHRLVGAILEGGASTTCYFTLEAYTPPEFGSVANVVEVVASWPTGEGGTVSATAISTVVTLPRLIALGIG